MTTLREHLEANEQLLGFALNAADVAAPQTLEEAIKQARKHALAALDLLDAEPHVSFRRTSNLGFGYSP